MQARLVSPACAALTVEDAVRSFRDPDGQPVTLQVERHRDAPPIEITVTPRLLDPC